MTYGTVVERWLLCAACAALAGCSHKAQVAPLPPLPPAVTVPLVAAPEPASPPQVQNEPVPAVPLPKTAVQPKVRRPKKKPDVPVQPAATSTQVASPSVAPPTAVPPSSQMASVEPPGAGLIGTLTAGADAGPAEKQRAADSIAAVEKALAGMGPATSDETRAGVTRVRNFLRQAHEALNSGDAEGASTLATKAKVLLDDLTNR